MQRLFVLMTLLFVVQVVQAQCDEGQLTTEVYGKIANKHRQNSAFTYGMASYQSHEDNFYFESSEEPVFYLGYGKSIWVGAKDANGEIRVAANTFPYLTRHDFIPGPLDRNTGQPIDTLCGVYNRVWVVKQIDVYQLQTKFQAGELTLEDIPTDILEWPAKGNPYLEEFSPDYDLAPFADLAEDGIYDPLSGDYPIVLTESPSFIPHQFSFIVFNDRGKHTETQSASLGIEFQQINYVVNCSEESESEQTVFTRINYNYLGSEELTDFKIALFEDSDFACNQNDYEGCDKALNCSYFYNANGETFLEECHDPDVPDNNGAVRTTVFLSQEMKSFKHWFLLGVGDTLVPGIDPTGAAEYYGYMNGVWRDGEPVTVGGNGYNPGSTDTTLFAFADRPIDPDGWSMQTAQLKVPLDGRALTTLIDEPMVSSGNSGTIDFADHMLYDKVNKKLTVFESIWPQKIEALKADFAAMQAGDFDCGGSLEICLEDCVWPGDVDNDFGVTAKDFLVAGIFSGFGITDGTPRNFASTEWFGFKADDWSEDFGNLNAKYGDVNGNGSINTTDLDGIATNFGQTRAGFEPELNVLTKTDSLGLVVEFEVDTVDMSTAAIFDQIVNTNFSLGNANEELAAPIYGLSYQVQFDTNLVRPFSKLDEIFSDIFDYNFVGMLNETKRGNLIEGDNMLHYAFTNLEALPSSSGGLLANQNLFIRDDAATRNPNGIDTLALKFINVCAVNAGGDLLELGVIHDTLIITNLPVDPDLISGIEEVTPETAMTLFPNPVVTELHILFDEPQSGQVIVYDLHGRKLQTQNIREQQQSTLTVDQLDSGLYMIQFTDRHKNKVVKTFVK